MDIVQIVDWLALSQIVAFAAIGTLSFRLARRLEEFETECRDLLRNAAVPAFFSLVLIGYGTYTLVAGRMPVPGGTILTGLAGYAGGSLLIMTGISLESILLRHFRRVRRDGIGAMQAGA